MNFFQHQEKAQQQTVKLVLLFAVAVFAVCLLTATTIALVFGHFFGGPTSSNNGPNVIGFITHPAFYWSALVTFSVILIGSVFKTLQLGGNGIQVALAMNAKYVHPDTPDVNERKLLNIVTEMALASGNPVPKVFKLPEEDINAFAAGHNRHQIVIAVTQGALEKLNRDELQGVIAHEFSHINFGDVKINMRLVALLHGILLIGHIGHLMVDWNRHSHHGSYHSNRRDSRSSGVGLAFIAIGFIGTLFGNMIKAAISRQREFLADAAAVQFTRNPDGIAGALKKIATQSDALQAPTAKGSQFSHFYFSNIGQHFFNRIFATHPAIDERISRLGHSLDFTPSPQTESVAPFNHHSSTMGFAGNDSAQPPTYDDIPYSKNAIEQTIASVGEPTDANLIAAQHQLAALPKILEEATHDAFRARTLIYAMLIRFSPQAIHSKQLATISAAEDAPTTKQTNILLTALQDLELALCFDLLLMAQRALSDQSPEQSMRFEHLTKSLIHADNTFTLFEWAVYRLAISPFKKASKSKQALKDATDALNQLFFYLASFTEVTHREQLLIGAQNALGIKLAKPEKISLKRLDLAVTELASIKPLHKPQLLKALMIAIYADGQATQDEITLLRTLALLIDCPIPPR